ncbi:MAG: N-formylglutamate deformylase [Lysobacteraceae bacterium]|nr:MAG: N-formylglutamate deformylase [Xanthomonadaceae bacterium]
MTSQAVYSLHRGTRPLLVSVPHDGVQLPSDVARKMTDAGRVVADTDWHVARLYESAVELGASVIRPNYSRYVVDLNRPSDGVALYPGQDETGLCPISSFAGEDLYKVGEEPSAEEVGERVRTYWQPYHSALRSELARLKAQHQQVLLWEGHTIKSEVPRFFEGRLPDFNIGTYQGASCSKQLVRVVETVLHDQQDYSWVVNGRFKGGYITRHYGQPDAGVHAIQLELSQRTYMNESPPFDWRESPAKRVQAVIRQLLTAAITALEIQ